MAIMAAHRILYAATASAVHPEDLALEVRTAMEMKGGIRFLHLLAGCPPGWKMPADQVVEVMRRAVESKVFPLYEVCGGREYRITNHSDSFASVEDYFELQGRFAPLRDDPDLLAHVRKEVDDRWDWLVEQDARR